MQAPPQQGMPPAFRGGQDMAGGPGRGLGGAPQRPMQQRPGAPGPGGPPNAPQRPGPPPGSMGGPGGPPPGVTGPRPMGSMAGLGGPPGGQQGPRPGAGGPPGGPRGPPGGPMGGTGGPMGGPPGAPMGGPPGGPMGGPPGGPMGPPGGPMGGPAGMRPGGQPGLRPMQSQMGGPGGPAGMQMRPPGAGGPMGGPQMPMMRGPTGQFEGPQRPMGGGGGTGGPPDMRGTMQGGPMPGQPGRPDTGSMTFGQMPPQPSPGKPAQAPAQKQAVYRPARRSRGRVNGGDTDKEVEEDIAAKGGLGTFKSLVVLSDNGDLGSWTGFQWKGRRVTGITFSKITHDPEGRIWFINDNWEVGRLTNSGFKNLGLLGNEFLVDLAFNPLDSSLWAVNRIGELLRWSGYSLERKAQHGFHKLKGITFDRKGNLWALNTACELAVWNEHDEEWDVKDVPGSLRMTDLAFDERNRLWIIGPEGQLMLLSGSKWVNFGFVGCWKMTDLSFKVPKPPSSPAAEAKAE